MTPKKRLNILLADDGSQHAQAAQELLQDLPFPPKSSILLLRAFGPGQVDWLPRFEKSLEESKARLEASGFRVETELKLGSPADLILQHSESGKLDLIVLGAKGLRSTVSILLGGVAQQVMEYAACPVLIVRAPYRGFRKVLAAVDGSGPSLGALRYLGKFPLPEGADIRLMHVLPPEQYPVMMEAHPGTWETIYTVLPAAEEEQEKQEQVQGGEALLDGARKLLKRHGIHAATVLERGDAATEIMDYVRANEMDLIVAGSYGMGNLRSLWVGSVSRKLIHYSNCSVLLVKEPKKE